MGITDKKKSLETESIDLKQALLLNVQQLLSPSPTQNRQKSPPHSNSSPSQTAVALAT